MIFKRGQQHVVYTAGAPVLREIAKPIAQVTSEIVTLAESMLYTLRLFNGIGLAAPQIGKSLRLVVFEVPENENGQYPTPGEEQLLPKMPLAVINPEIISTSGEIVERDEGCLSVPDIWAPVPRPERIVWRATTLADEQIECECGGLLARCIQHELDHLNGVIFTDRTTPQAATEIKEDLDRLIKRGGSCQYRRMKRK